MSLPSHPNMTFVDVHDYPEHGWENQVQTFARVIIDHCEDMGIPQNSVGDILIKPPDKHRLRDCPKDWLILIHSREPDGFQELDRKEYGL